VSVDGREALALMERLLPLRRSLTGDGVRATLDVLEEHIPLSRTEVPTGTPVFDWTVPDEWNLHAAWITGPDGRRVLDARDSSLHVVGYSEPVRARLSLEALRDRLHTLPGQPDAVPWRTSYYARTWGFCLAHRALEALPPGEYEVCIDATLAPGHLTYAECVIPGAEPDEVLFSTYVCHPALANDNLSGIVVATLLARELRERAPRHTCRVLFAPGTLGPLAWLRDHLGTLHRLRHGVALSCLGDRGGFTYKRSRRGDAEVDKAAEVVLRDAGAEHRVLPFEPWGGDERQFGSPGFDLPVGALSRTPHGEFEGYHTSADSLERIAPEALAGAVEACLAIVAALDGDRAYRNLSPFGEPQLGRRGLFRSAGGAVETPDDERALLWVLNQSDGSATLLDVAARSGLPHPTVRRAAERLVAAGLLEVAQPEKSGQVLSRSETMR
jgi:aminopeptidase-like protein